MSIVAWDGVTMAADRCAWQSGKRLRTRHDKVQWVDSADRGMLLVGMAGDVRFNMAAVEALCGRAPWPDCKLYGQEPTSLMALAVDGRRRLWSVCTLGKFVRLDERRWALGACSDMALGALLAGASAKRAAEICIERTDDAGFGVQAISWS